MKIPLSRLRWRPDGKDGDRVGHEAERRFVKGIGDARDAWPEWLLSLRHATQEEDALGIDVVFTTDVGDIHVQIKRSIRLRTNFLGRDKKDHYPSICIVVSPATRFPYIFSYTISQLRQERARMLRSVTP